MLAVAGDLTIREQARRDYLTVERQGYVMRDDQPREAHGAWRSAITGACHRRGLRITTGVARGKVWAAINLEPLDPWR